MNRISFEPRFGISKNQADRLKQASLNGFRKLYEGLAPAVLASELAYEHHTGKCDAMKEVLIAKLDALPNQKEPLEKLYETYRGVVRGLNSGRFHNQDIPEDFQALETCRARIPYKDAKDHA